MKLTKNYILQNILDEYSLIPVAGNKVKLDVIINLNESAYFIYDKIAKGFDEAEILDALKAEYNADALVLKNDLNEMLDYFERKGVIER